MTGILWMVSFSLALVAIKPQDYMLLGDWIRQRLVLLLQVVFLYANLYKDLFFCKTFEYTNIIMVMVKAVTPSQKRNTFVI